MAYGLSQILKLKLLKAAGLKQMAYGKEKPVRFAGRLFSLSLELEFEMACGKLQVHNTTNVTLNLIQGLDLAATSSKEFD